MSNRKVAISGGPNSTEAMVTGQQELLVRVNSTATTANSNVTIVDPLGAQPSNQSVSIALAIDQAKVGIIPNLLLSQGESATIIPGTLLAISFASNGTNPALITVDGGVTYLYLPTGTTINFDAGGILNIFPLDCFGYDTSDAGASLIITYNIKA